MKYNKEKTKKFQKGGKSPKEIMEEARRNQAIERQAQARDEVKTSGIAAYQSAPTTIQAPRQEVALKEYEPISFSEAFRRASKARLKEFDWLDPKTGKMRKIAVKLANESTNTNTNTATSTNTSENNASTAQSPNSAGGTTSRQLIQIGNSANTGFLGSNGRKADLTIPRQLINIGNPDNKQLISIGNPATAGFLGPNRKWVDFNDPQKNRQSVEEVRQRKLAQLSSLSQTQLNVLLQDANERLGLTTRGAGLPEYQQGGQIPSYQQGDKLHLRNVWERIFGITPDYTPVNSQESITSYMDNTRKGPVEKRVIRKEVPYAKLHSTMSIRNPGTNRADTTFTAPSGTTYNMNDVRSGKAPSGYSYKFFKNPAGYFQQGGTVDKKESGSTDQLYVDFAIRYLKAKGIPEDDMVDNEGGLKDEFLEEVSTAINEVDSPDFWEQYQSDPDAIIQSYVESKMEPAQIEMARKGAKLKKLKKGGMKSKKCKCGCNLTMKKEAGGKIKEVCACGCKK